VFKSAAVTRRLGQIIDGGATRKRLQMPPIEKPISWVDMTNSHWSVSGNETIIKWMSASKRTSKIGTLIIEDPLASNGKGLKVV
jgi:hypothetical protein